MCATSWRLIQHPSYKYDIDVCNNLSCHCCKLWRNLDPDWTLLDFQVLDEMDLLDRGLDLIGLEDLVGIEKTSQELDLFEYQEDDLQD